MPIRVLISYTHDTPEHMDRVWDLAERLRGDGIDCRIDQHEESPPEGWPRWCLNQVEESQFVVVACTETYLRRYRGKEDPGKGRGGNWEGLAITHELYNAQGQNKKFIPIVFSDEDSLFVPLELQGSARYKPTSEDGYEDLLRRLTGQPRKSPKDVASQVPALPTVERKTQQAREIDNETYIQIVERYFPCNLKEQLTHIRLRETEVSTHATLSLPDVPSAPSIYHLDT